MAVWMPLAIRNFRASVMLSWRPKALRKLQKRRPPFSSFSPDLNSETLISSNLYLSWWDRGDIPIFSGIWVQSNFAVATLPWNCRLRCQRRTLSSPNNVLSELPWLSAPKVGGSALTSNQPGTCCSTRAGTQVCPKLTSTSLREKSKNHAPDMMSDFETYYRSGNRRYRSSRWRKCLIETASPALQWGQMVLEYAASILFFDCNVSGCLRNGKRGGGHQFIL